MKLKMIGIDFTRAEIDVRQCFSFTKRAMAEAMGQIRQNRRIQGCVLISTCNRMELWVSLRQDEEGLDLSRLLCGLKGLEAGRYRRYLTEREDEEAVRHLFYLSAGLKSQILGEDQILAQIKDALSFAREQDCTDRMLEVLFRMAVTAGKQVKTKVILDKVNFSAAHQALDYLKSRGNALEGKTCLVIGNGEMGKLTAQALMEEGADVTVTVRQYRSGVVNIPRGAKRIDYGERYQYIPQCALVVSATASPNLTIDKKRLSEYLEAADLAARTKEKQIYLDLAVPRDIDKSIGELAGVEYYDMDSLPIQAQSQKMRRQYREAEGILAEEIQKFLDWQECRDAVPRIQKIGADTAKELFWRLEKPLKGLKLSEEAKKNFQKSLEETAAKVVDRLLFELRDQASQEILVRTIEIFEQVYAEKSAIESERK